MTDLQRKAQTARQMAEQGYIVQPDVIDLLRMIERGELIEACKQGGNAFDTARSTGLQERPRADRKP